MDNGFDGGFLAGVGLTLAVGLLVLMCSGGQPKDVCRCEMRSALTASDTLKVHRKYGCPIQTEGK